MVNLTQNQSRRLVRVALHMARAEKLSSALPSTGQIKRAFVQDSRVIAVAVIALIAGILVSWPA